MNSALKDRIKAMMEARDRMEKEIEERLARLDAPGGGGRTGSLVDAEGFPRSDINIYSVREDRNRVAVLTNDHKSLTDQIQQALIELHQQTRDSMGIDLPVQRESSSRPTVTAEQKYHPFAFVDSVSPDSPASEAGIEVGDELCKFGTIAGEPTKIEGILSRLAASLKVHIDQPVGQRLTTGLATGQRGETSGDYIFEKRTSEDSIINS